MKGLENHHIKSIIKQILIVSGLTLATTGFAGVGQFEGETTCYVFKQNKLLKKLSCQYDGEEGASSTYGFINVRYSLPGFGVMETAYSIEGYDDNGHSYGDTTTVNDQPAIVRYRDRANLRVINQQATDSASNLEIDLSNNLECYLSTKSHWEICANIN